MENHGGQVYTMIAKSANNLYYMRLLDEEYLKTPFYFIIWLSRWFGKKGHKVKHKRVKRLMRLMSWNLVEEAIQDHGKLEIINSDQDCRFTIQKYM